MKTDNRTFTKIIFVSITLLMLFPVLLTAQTFTNFTTAEGLPDDYINGIAIDGLNNKWIATANGAASFNDVTWTVYTTADGLPADNITGIAVDNNDNVWAGTDMGVAKYDGDSWTVYTTSDGLIDNSITYIAVDADNNVWFTSFSGLSRFDGTSWTNFTANEGLPVDFISYITFDASGNKWIGTLMGGLVRYNDTIFTVFTTSDGLADDNINCIAIDAYDNKFAGTFYGVSRLDHQNNVTGTYTSADGLYNEYVKDMKFDSQGNLCIGIFADYLQDGAITIFDGADFVSLSTPEGLVSKDVRKIAVDHEDNFWIGTGSGLSKLDHLTGIGKLKKADTILIFPNPANDYVYIDSSAPSVYTITGTTGQIVLNGALEPVNNIIKVNNLHTGVYIFKISDGKTSCNKKLIINR